MMGQMAEPLARGQAGASSSVALLSDFGGWMASEQRRIFVLCLRLLQDPDEADSATQDVFFKAYQALHKGPELDDPARWVTRIAVNACLDRLRSRKWRFWRRGPGSVDGQAALEIARSQAPEAEDRYFAAQIAARLNAALERLSTRQRAVFTLRHYEDKSLEEIGSLLGLDVGTVKAHMFRAVSKLRKELRDLYEGSR
jgi:RNA polymerase sigma-70 factor (ECF subfamily)